MDKEKSIFLIEEGWVDPSENKKADGYVPYRHCATEGVAKDFCEKQGHFTKKDCWSVSRYPDGKMPKFRYKEIPYLETALWG